MTCSAGNLLSNLHDACFRNAPRMFFFALYPQAQTCANGGSIIGTTIMRVEIFGMENQIGIKAAIAQPFRSGRESGVIHIAQIVWIILALAQPFFEIQTTYFIIILNGFGIVLLLLDPFPGGYGSFFPGLVNDPGAGEF